jgi:hypothetical protein
MPAHTNEDVRRLLHKAKQFLADGEARLNRQESRVLKLDSKGQRNAESGKLLRNMRQAHALMIQYVRLLESEIHVDGERPPEIPADGGTGASPQT